MSRHRIAPIPLPAFFSATIVRSDGDAAKVWIDGPKRRAEMIVAGRCVSITIIRPDRGLMYSIDPISRTYFEIPVGDAEVAVMEANVEDDVEWELVGIADIDGRRYDEYEAWANDGECPFPRERICIDPKTPGVFIVDATIELSDVCDVAVKRYPGTDKMVQAVRIRAATTRLIETVSVNDKLKSTLDAGGLFYDVSLSVVDGKRKMMIAEPTVAVEPRSRAYSD